MIFTDLIPYLVSLIISIITGVLAFLTSTNKSKKDLQQLQEQNKHDLEKLLNQHKLDLEGLEIRHKQEIEKIDLEHKHKIELMEKEAQNNLGSNILTSVFDQAMKMPEIQKSLRTSLSNKNKPKKH